MNTFCIIESIPLLRTKLSEVIELNNQAKVVASFSDIDRIVEYMGKVEPDWIWLDGTIAGVENVRVLHDLKVYFPTSKFIIFGQNNSISQVRKYYTEGAKAYLSKQVGSDTLLSALSIVLAGNIFLSPEVMESAFSWITQHKSKNKRESAMLTAREKQVLDLITHGFTSKQIADRLCVSSSTIETHRINLLQKLGVKNTAGLVRIAFEQNLCATG